MEKKQFLLVLLLSLLAFIGCKKEEVVDNGGTDEATVLKISETELTVDASGGTLLLGVTSNISWCAVSDAEWCVLENYSNRGNGSVTVRVSANVSSSEREAKLTVSGGELKLEAIVKQSGAAPENNEESTNGNGNGEANENVNENGDGTGLEPLDKSSGKLPGKFSVSSTKQVIFSKGNLQYKAISNVWKFAENQYDVIGADNKNISATYEGWIDLFGWGTSGYNDRFPYMTSSQSEDYGDGAQGIGGTNYDWGIFNYIEGGGYSIGRWRTLTEEEWTYLYEGRANADRLRGMATVNDVTGYIFLPDDWKLPKGLAFTENLDTYSENNYSSSEWSKMESAGALFLPSAGMRDGTNVHYVGISGFYHSTTNFGDKQVRLFYFTSSSYKYVTPNHSDLRCRGRSVRLVQD